tara:strand:+ start:8585 stop:8902 length:318 start_codon:yes stop_codon:yes gene_type:complete
MKEDIVASKEVIDFYKNRGWYKKDVENIGAITRNNIGSDNDSEFFDVATRLITLYGELNNSESKLEAAKLKLEIAIREEAHSFRKKINEQLKFCNTAKDLSFKEK